MHLPTFRFIKKSVIDGVNTAERALKVDPTKDHVAGNVVDVGFAAERLLTEAKRENLATKESVNQFKKEVRYLSLHLCDNSRQA